MTNSSIFLGDRMDGELNFVFKKYMEYFTKNPFKGFNPDHDTRSSQEICIAATNCAVYLFQTKREGVW